MTSSRWIAAVCITLLVAVAAWGFSRLAVGRFQWGPPEKPKAQGEALDIDSMLAGKSGDYHDLRYRDTVARAVIREPENTWTNLVFIFAGAAIALHDRRVFPRFLGAALIALGFSSGLYHASLSPAWRTVDVATMGWTVFALGCLGFAAIWPVSHSHREQRPLAKLALGSIGLPLAAVVAMFRNDVRIGGVKPFDSTYVTVLGVLVVFLLLIVGIFLAARGRMALRPLTLKIAVLGLLTLAGVLCQLGDHPGHFFFRPNGFIQGHALWHLLMGVAALLTYDLFAILEGRPSLWDRPT